MDLMARRRQLMTMQTTQNYIQSGLELWLDAIDKGSVAGSWVDKISGFEFSGINDPVFGSDYIELDGSRQQYLSNNLYEPPLSSDGTIEVVVTHNTTGNAIIFSAMKSSGISVGIYNTASVIWSMGSNMPIANTGIFRTCSITSGIAYADGVEKSFGNGNSWGGAIISNYIGRRTTGNYFTGKIHAIRIYNRHLTAQEMLHNQRIDNKRFNLGLAI